jgi:hypothetical protein
MLATDERQKASYPRQTTQITPLLTLNLELLQIRYSFPFP